MTARANIRTILDVRANDKASRAIKGVRRQLGSLGQAARSALAGDQHDILSALAVAVLEVATGKARRLLTSSSTAGASQD